MKKNINQIIAMFILMSPLLDLITGICIHTLNISLTVGIIVRMIFLLFIVLVTIFIFKKKKLIIPYLILGLYFILYTIGIIVYKDGVGLFSEIQGLIKVFYFPILFMALYSIKDKIKISRLTYTIVLFTYLILIFIPTIFNIGYKTYEITKAGTLGFFNSANEISGIISLLTPIAFIVFIQSKKIISKIILIPIYLIVILMMGTKTPLLTLSLTIGFSLIYLWIKSFKAKKYKNIIISLIIVIIMGTSLVIVLPKTNFYKNIQTHLDYLKVDNITDVFKDEKLLDHFIFSQRLTFLNKKNKLYNNSSLYQKVFGIGYLKSNGKATKLIEMDYFDIYYHHGVVGFILFFSIFMYLLYKVLCNRRKGTYDSYMFKVSLLFILFLSFFTGHIITAPSVSLIAILIILELDKKKKNLLFTDANMKIGGIENAQINLLKRIDYTKYNVDLVLEEKTGDLLVDIPSKVNVKELKVSNNRITVLRKLINTYRKLIFKVFNYHNYDFSCCYTTYSYSCNKLAKIGSLNNAFYVHSDYSNVYNNEKDFREFFDSRKVNEYKNIIFVSNESRESFLKYYPELSNKTYVFNNFIDVNRVIEMSKEEIDIVKPKETLFVFIGRLDDSSKKLKRAINIIKNIKGIELWVIGDGPDREMYEEYAKGSNVKFLGKKKNPYPYLNEADYFILTSDYEGFPVTYLESLILNKKIITTINTSDESINMKDYAYIISKDEDKMISEVKDILKNKKPINKIGIEKLQEKRIKELEEIFNQ